MIQTKIGRYSVVIAAAVVAVALFSWLLWLWYGKRDPLPVKQWQQAPEARPVADVIKVPHPAPRIIQVVPKAVAAKQLELPPDITADDLQQVVATAEVAPAPDGARTVTVMNTTTGEARTIIKANPKPFFAFLRTGAAGVRYGIASSGDQQGALYVRQDMLRLANLYMSVTAEARTMPSRGASEAFGGIDVSYRWD